MLSDLGMFSYWGKQPSNTAFNNWTVEMQQNVFFQVTFSVTRNLKQKNIVSINNKLCEVEICHMPQLGGH